MDLVTEARTKILELDAIFLEGGFYKGGERDLGKVRRYGGNVRAALDDIRARNVQLEGLAAELERTPDTKSAGWRALFGAPEDNELGDYHRLPVRRAKHLPLLGAL